MGLLQSIRSAFGGDGAAGFEEPPFPDDRPSIYRALEARRRAAGEVCPLPEMELPDKKRYEAAPGRNFHFGPGSNDALLDQPAGQGHARETVAVLLAALKRACKRPGRRSALALHEAIPKEQVLGLIDPLLGELRDLRLDPGNLHRIAHWLATESPDREPVKLGIALLGASSAVDNDDDLFFTLGGHDEFTLYAAVAIRRRHAPEAADRALWLLARLTDGWGRIQAIDKMSAAPPPEVAGWLLREGYVNQIGYDGQTERNCATKGDLLRALRGSSRDEALLVGAGEILTVLTTGKPGPWMGEYPDGAEAAKAWVDAEASQPPGDLRRLLALGRLKDFARAEEGDWSELEPFGWTAGMRLGLAEAAGRSIGGRRWEALVRRDLEADDSKTFGRAARAAAVLGIDVWEHIFARLCDNRGDDYWWLMRTDDPARAGRVAALAEQRFDLDAIAIGPAMEMGSGVFSDPAVSIDASELNGVVKSLARFPGMGAALVLAELKSPVFWDRGFAIDTLAAWPRESWPPEVAPALVAAVEAEPDPELRGRMAAVRDGLPLGD